MFRDRFKTQGSKCRKPTFTLRTEIAFAVKLKKIPPRPYEDSDHIAAKDKRMKNLFALPLAAHGRAE